MSDPTNSLRVPDSGQQDVARRQRDSGEVHPIIRQIIDRDCHVGDSDQTVVRHVISKLRGGYDTYRGFSREERERFVTDCVQHHAANFREYVATMNGFIGITIVSRQAEVVPNPFTGSDLVSLMRKHRVTIRMLAKRIGTSMKRVRQLRASGITDAFVLRDWLQAITGNDPGPIANKYRIGGRTKEEECSFCGCPLLRGDEAYQYVGDVFCSLSCCRQSKGWK